jgi:uncharacterized Ntn-hydrolase superfamily protein
LNGLLAADEGRRQRQVGIVDREGRAATFTGEECFAWAGGRTGRNYAAQGNILTGPEVVDQMAETFERTTGTLADRLLAALAAGQEAGGDSRGQQSSALIIVKPTGGYAGFNDRFVDLRVDDHPTPITEMSRILEIHKLYFFETNPEDTLTIDGQLAGTIQEILLRSGHRKSEPTGHYDEETREAFRALCGEENLENRWREGSEVDRVVVEYLERKYGLRDG